MDPISSTEIAGTDLKGMCVCVCPLPRQFLLGSLRTCATICANRAVSCNGPGCADFLACIFFPCARPQQSAPFPQYTYVSPLLPSLHRGQVRGDAHHVHLPTGLCRRRLRLCRGVFSCSCRVHARACPGISVYLYACPFANVCGFRVCVLRLAVFGASSRCVSNALLGDACAAFSHP